MAATKRIRVDRTFSTDNEKDATVSNFLSITNGAPGFNSSTGVISIPNTLSQLSNDAGFITNSALSSYQPSLVSGSSIKTVNSTSLLGSGNISVQATLVSGTNIKTVNGNSLLGSGDISISGGVSLPSQTSNSGKYLTTDGTNLSWATVSGGSGSVSNLYIDANGNDGRIGIGIYTAGSNQGPGAVAIGQSAGYSSQSQGGVAIGNGAATYSQGARSVAIGDTAGFQTQGQYSVAIGYNAANNSQGTSAIAIGGATGQNNQGQFSIAIGDSAGYSNQGTNAIAIGYNAGYSSQASKSIVLNANDQALNATQSGFYVSPVRSDATPTNIIYYNTATKEMTYGAAPAGSSGGGSSPANPFVLKTGGAMISYSMGDGTFTAPATGKLLVEALTYNNEYVMSVGGPGLGPFSSLTGMYASFFDPNAPGSQGTAYYSTQSITSGATVHALTSNGGTGSMILYAWTLDNSTDPSILSCVHANNMGQSMGGGPLTMNNSPQNMGQSWMSPNYFYGYMYLMGMGDLSTFTAAQGVTAHYDASAAMVGLKVPASIWATGGSFGSIPGYDGSFGYRGYFFGQ